MRFFKENSIRFNIKMERFFLSLKSTLLCSAKLSPVPADVLVKAESSYFPLVSLCGCSHVALVPQNHWHMPHPVPRGSKGL